LLVVVLLLLAVGASTIGAQEPERNPVPAYLLSWLVGFGTGHFYMRDDAAVRFLLLDAISYAATLGGTIYLYSVVLDPYATYDDTGIYIGAGVAIIGALVYTGVRIWEIVDIFQVADEQRMRRRTAVAPTLAIGADTVGVGLSFSY
jgi:hypothetical protein